MPDFLSVPWLYFLPLAAYLPLVFAIFFPKASIPLVCVSALGAVAFVTCGLIFGVTFPLICAFLCLEGCLFFLLNIRGRKKEQVREGEKP